jgi:carboxyl-terminal processing protease
MSAKAIWKRYTANVILCAALGLAAGCGLLDRTPPTATPLPTPDATARQLNVFDAAWASVRDRYVRSDFDGVDWEAVGDEYRTQIEAGLSEEEFVAAIRAMLATLPGRQATYQTRAERLAEETTDSSVYHGIGAFIAFRETPEPHIVILAVVGGSPAEAAGLETHDSIYAINGSPITLEDAAAPATRIRGLPDSNVTLTIGTPGRGRREVTMDRAEIRATDVLRGGLLTSLDVAYYRIPVVATASVAANISADLNEIAGDTELKGIILDLRVARSGTTWPLAEMLTVFADGAMGEFYDREGADPVEVAGTAAGASQSAPLVVLTGPDTEGTPEIFAAALQAAGRAIVIGQDTLGEVQGFAEIALPDGSRMFLATSSYRTTTGLDLAATGVTPDVVIDADWDSFTTEDDPVIEAALAFILSGG